MVLTRGKPTPGPGKYDDICTYARKRAEAAIALLLIVGGKRGGGFSVQMDSHRVRDAGPQIIVRLLREIADQIERENTI